MRRTHPFFSFPATTNSPLFLALYDKSAPLVWRAPLLHHPFYENVDNAPSNTHDLSAFSYNQKTYNGSYVISIAQVTACLAVLGQCISTYSGGSPFDLKPTVLADPSQPDRIARHFMDAKVNILAVGCSLHRLASRAMKILHRFTVPASQPVPPLTRLCASVPGNGAQHSSQYSQCSSPPGMLSGSK